MPGPRERAADLAERVATVGDRLREAALGRSERFASRAPAPVRTGLELAVATVRDARRDRVPGLAAEVALFTLISLPALLLVVLGSLGFVADVLGPDGRAELDRLVFTVPRAALSGDTFAAYEQLVRPVTREGRVDVIGFGLLLGLWTGSRATNRVLETVTIAYDLEHPRARWRQRILALGMTVAATVGAVALLPLLVLGPRLMRALAPDGVAAAGSSVLDWLFWPLVGLLVVVALATVFHVGVPWRTPWRRDLPGAVLAMALWLVAAAGLRLYLALSGASLDGGETVYRQLSAPIAVSLWLWVSALAVLLGAELNAEIEKRWPTGAYGPRTADGPPHRRDESADGRPERG
ncbi:YihY/virulence factor BrkB family protein [Nocardioidaceae bacterium]|nr:YihY/virulence factor BrkB family protein [Nocardioidaceae bacterium]